MVLGWLDVTCKRMKLDPYLILYTTINKKWRKYQNIITQTVKLLEDKTEKSFTSHTSDKGLLSRIYKELIQLNSKRQPN